MCKQLHMCLKNFSDETDEIRQFRNLRPSKTYLSNGSLAANAGKRMLEGVAIVRSANRVHKVDSFFESGIGYA